MASVRLRHANTTEPSAVLIAEPLPQSREAARPSEQKVWLVTGAGRGLGVDIAKAALAAGHAVVATARSVESIAPMRLDGFTTAPVPAKFEAGTPNVGDAVGLAEPPGADDPAVVAHCRHQHRDITGRHRGDRRD
mgnify:CR=1 FL=1